MFISSIGLILAKNRESTFQESCCLSSNCLQSELDDKLYTNLFLTLVNEDVGAARHQICKINLRNVGVINNGLICRINRKIIKLELDLIDIPKKLRGVLSFYSDEVLHAKDKSRVDRGVRVL